MRPKVPSISPLPSSVSWAKYYRAGVNLQTNIQTICTRGHTSYYKKYVSLICPIFLYVLHFPLWKNWDVPASKNLENLYFFLKYKHIPHTRESSKHQTEVSVDVSVTADSFCILTLEKYICTCSVRFLVYRIFLTEPRCHRQVSGIRGMGQCTWNFRGLQILTWKNVQIYIPKYEEWNTHAVRWYHLKYSWILPVLQDLRVTPLVMSAVVLCPLLLSFVILFAM